MSERYFVHLINSLETMNYMDTIHLRIVYKCYYYFVKRVYCLLLVSTFLKKIHLGNMSVDLYLHLLLTRNM